MWTARLPYEFSSLTTTRHFVIFFVYASAVELALALRPEVVLLDVTMPWLDGFGAAMLI